MIQAALDAGEDTTGLCTVRELAQYILNSSQPYHCELFFELAGRRINVEVAVTAAARLP